MKWFVFVLGFGTFVRTKGIDHQDLYLRKHGAKLVDIASCEGIQFFNEDLEVYEEEEDYEETECHVDQLEDHHSSIKDVFGEGVKACCPDKFLSVAARCGGTDKEGNLVGFTNIDVCVDHVEAQEGEKKHYSTASINCPADCHLEKGTADVDTIKAMLQKKSNNAISLVKEGKTYTEFCLALKCNDDGDQWHYHYQACGSCKTVQDRNMELRNRNATKFDLCCGPNGTLDTKTMTCNNGVALPKEVASCNWKNKMNINITKIDDGEPSDSMKFICVSTMVGKSEDGLFQGGITCDQDCKEDKPCYRSCHGKGRAYDPNLNLPTSLNGSFDFSTILDFDSHIAYGYPPGSPIENCEPNRTLVLYPDRKDSCRDRVKFQKDGDLMVLRETGKTFHYGEFCISPTSGNHDKGTYKVNACSKGVVTEKQNKFKFYYIVLIFSIISLTATISIYAFFHSTLLRSDYNKIMLNFSISLLLAFVVLVILQAMLPREHKTVPMCRFLALTNQFFILSAFFWMTLMSYEIFKQIHGMRVVDRDGHRGVLQRKAPIGYGIPAFIVLITLIVEVAAPQCSSIRPKFGDKKTEAMVTKRGSPKEKFDQMCLYLRLFFGMGIIWYFELIAFFVNGAVAEEVFYLTDTLNMLQGVWVFVTFVCKRNVMKVVTKQRDELYSMLNSNIQRTSLRRSSVTHRQMSMSQLETARDPSRRATANTFVSQSEGNRTSLDAGNRASLETYL